MHGTVCMWCNASCYDVIADRYDHSRATPEPKERFRMWARLGATVVHTDDPSHVLLCEAKTCDRCGVARLMRHDAEGHFYAIEPCAVCAEPLSSERMHPWYTDDMTRKK